MPAITDAAWSAQQKRNAALIANSTYMRDSFTSQALPLTVDIATTADLDGATLDALEALERQAARIAIKSLVTLGKLGEVDHLGGALDLIPALLLTQILTDYRKIEYTIENAHCSIGYYANLAALGFIDQQVVVDKFRQSLDIPGHVSWVPGGTQLQGGRLGVMVPAAVGQSLAKRAIYGNGSWVVCHTGDAGWVSGQALNGFNAADLHRAPVTFVMQRNGLQLSSACHHILNKDPRLMVSAMGIEILEVPTLLDQELLYSAYREGYRLALEGRPSMIYPTGYGRGVDDSSPATVADIGKLFGIEAEVKAFADKNGVPLSAQIWIPGSLMSYRDVVSMLECIFLVNDLPGGKDHHDGSMKGRDEAAVLGNPMMVLKPEHEAVLAKLRAAAPRTVVTKARPAPGSPNLVLSAEALKSVALPMPGKAVSARAGVEPAYALIAKTFPEKMFVVSCDLDPSTKLGKARTFLAADHQFELSIEEQIAAIVTNGLSCGSVDEPQFNVVSTFSAFFEGIAREGCEMWRYQRNLNGVNEGLNVCFHLSHVGACTGRDHFSGWSLDWITLAMGYLPYIHRFYAPADARAAFIAIRDAAANYGGHIVAIPRDNLPILTKQGTTEPLWEADSAWEPVTTYRKYPGATRAILAMGATVYLAEEASNALLKAGLPTDVYVVNGLPTLDTEITDLVAAYPGGLVSVEDGIIGTRATGLRGFASLVASNALGSGVPIDHVGIVDPRVAPADGHPEVWEHFGLTTHAVILAVQGLA